MFVLVEFSSIIFGKKEDEELLILSLVITSTVLPTVLKDCKVFPGEMTITGISPANTGVNTIKEIIKKINDLPTRSIFTPFKFQIIKQVFF